MKKYFGTDGIRDTVGKGCITPEFMLKLGYAAGKVLKNDGCNRIVIGKDTRKSGYMLETALESGLISAGMDVIVIGPLPTPGVAYIVRTFRACAGIMITASHNSYTDNGVKFFDANGYKFSDELETSIEKAIDAPMEVVDVSELGKATRIEDAKARYIEHCKSTIPAKMDFGDYTIVLDCANGATYGVAPSVFEEIGAVTYTINDKPDGININENCGATNLESLKNEVFKQNADIGIAFDGDGDRVMMIDSTSRVIDGDKIMYIIAADRLAFRGIKQPVVGTTMTNLGTEKAINELGLSLIRSDVGDHNVIEAMKENDAVIGAENSGHVICADRTTTGDGIIGALQVMAAMWKEKKTLKKLAEPVILYPQILVNVVLDKDAFIDYNKLDMMKTGAEISMECNGRVLLRESGTEPLLRVMVEGDDEQEVYELAHSLATNIDKMINKQVA